MTGPWPSWARRHDGTVRTALRVAEVQPACAARDVAGNAEVHAAAVRAAEARVVVFPELSLTGYECELPRYLASSDHAKWHSPRRAHTRPSHPTEVSSQVSHLHGDAGAVAMRPFSVVRLCHLSWKTTADTHHPRLSIELHQMVAFQPRFVDHMAAGGTRPPPPRHVLLPPIRRDLSGRL